MKKGFTTLELVVAVIAIFGTAGWVTNVIWLFSNFEVAARPIMALVGVFVAPVGAIHGIYCWF